MNNTVNKLYAMSATINTGRKIFQQFDGLLFIKMKITLITVFPQTFSAVYFVDLYFIFSFYHTSY